MKTGSLIALLWIGGLASATSTCTHYCSCDKWQGLRRAVCSHKMLSSIEADVPHKVQVLDLSSNFIRSIEDNSFQKLNMTFLKQLNLSRNHIQHIDWNAFQGLTDLQELDLSYNHLKYLLQGIFLVTPQLKTLILSGNELGGPRREPLLDVPSLKVLYISQCRFDHLKTNTFLKMESLIGLDISDNYLAQLDVTTLSPLQDLQKINLSKNRWHCDNKTQALTTYLTNRNIEYTPICKQKEEINTDQDKFSVNEPDNDVEMLTEGSFWPDEDDEEDKNAKMMVENSTPPISVLQEKFKTLFYVTHLLDKIPSFWAFVIGLQIGIVVATSGMLLCVNSRRTRSNVTTPPVQRRQGVRRSLRIRSSGSSNPWIELEHLDCPDTPPPPYKDINSVLNNA